MYSANYLHLVYHRYNILATVFFDFILKSVVVNNLVAIPNQTIYSVQGLDCPHFALYV